MPSPRPLRFRFRHGAGLVVALITIAATFTVAPGRAGAVTAAKPLRVTTQSLPAPTGGGTYTATLAAAGGHAPYHWSISAGRLPKGLALSTTGVISGTPK